MAQGLGPPCSLKSQATRERPKKKKKKESPFSFSLHLSEKKKMSFSYKLPSHFLSYILSFKCKYGICDLQASSRFLKDYAIREFNALLWISLIAVTALLLEEVFKIFRLWSKARLIAGPPCDSFFGHTNFGSRENFIDFLSELHNTYGSIFKLWMGPTQPLVSVKDPALVKEILFKAEDKLQSTGKAFRLAFGRSSLFFCSYDQARGRRESLALQLNKKLLGKAGIISKRVVDRIMERIDENLGKGSVDHKLISQHMAFTILGTALLGDTFLEWSKSNLYEELLMRIVKDASFWASYRVTPFWKQGFWRYQSLCTKLKMLTQDITQQCRKHCGLFHHFDQKSDDEMVTCGMKTTCGISLNVQMQDRIFSRECDGLVNAIEEPYGNIMCMMVHGCIATAGLMGNILDKLVTDPELQDKIYSEIIIARKGSAEEGQNVDKMFLLLATIYESARILPAGPLLQRCLSKDDLRLENGVTIPAGAVLVVPVHLLQMDRTSWGNDAKKFNPYRFLSEARKVSDSVEDTSFTGDSVEPIPSSFTLKDPNENAAFLTFGSGIRACVGQKFVVQGVASLFASLLEHYKVMPKPKSDNDPQSTSADVVFVRRSS